MNIVMQDGARATHVAIPDTMTADELRRRVEAREATACLFCNEILEPEQLPGFPMHRAKNGCEPEDLTTIYVPSSPATAREEEKL